MNLKKIHVYSHRTAKQVEDLVNSAIAAADEIEDEEVGINYELMIENSVTVGTYTETYYTLIIHEYDASILEIDLGEE